MAKKTAHWLEGKSWHRIRNEMLQSPAWKAASHLQQSMVFALVGELGTHSGKNNGDLKFTNRDWVRFGFCRDRIKRNLIAIRALGFIAYKAGRPGLKGYGIARRYRLTFLPILDVDGNEVEPPTDEWARFATTRDAKEAARKALLRTESVPTGTQNGPLSQVVLKTDHLTGEHNGRLSKEMPINIDVTGTQNGPLSTSMLTTHTLGRRNQSEVGPRAGLPWSTPTLVEVTDPAELAAIRSSVGLEPAIPEAELPWSARRCAYCSRPKPGPKDYGGLTVWLHERCQHAWEEAQVRRLQ
jgi:hypothetical protein